MTTPTVAIESKTLADALASPRAKVKVGVEQLDRGEGAEWNVDEVKAKGRALLAARRSSVASE